jgi:hypothetical protein
LACPQNIIKIPKANGKGKTASNSHFGGGDGEEEGRERAKKDWKLRG